MDGIPRPGRMYVLNVPIPANTLSVTVKEEPDLESGTVAVLCDPVGFIVKIEDLREIPFRINQGDV